MQLIILDKFKGMYMGYENLNAVKVSNEIVLIRGLP